MNRYRTMVAVLGMLLMLSAVMAFGQTSNGTISGTVTDPTNAVVANATVTAKSTLTGETHQTTTNASGAYRFEVVSPGVYAVSVAVKGFATKTIRDIDVRASVVTPVNVEMTVGSTSETVEVQAAAAQIQTENGELSHTINESEVSKLPISSLNAYALAATLPGVTTVSDGIDYTNGTSFAVNGTRPRSNNFLIEGQDNNDAGIHGQGLQPNNLDAIKEVSVMTNSYAAEYGAGGGSVSNLIFKSGSNQFHGAAWELHRSSALDANDHQNNYYGDPKPPSHENIFGFDIGGPIKKDKLFGFFSYQWDKYRASSQGDPLTLPTAAGVATLQSLLPNPRIQNYLNAIGSLRGDPAVENSIIALGGGRPSVEFGRYVRSGIPANSESPEMDIKGDYLITKNDTLNLRLIKNSFSTPYDLGNFPDRLPAFDSQQSGDAYNAGISYTHIFNSNIINELRVSYGRIGFTFALRPDTLSNPLAMGPTVSIDGITGYGIYPGTLPQGRFHNTYQYQDGLSWSRGSHFFKFGFDYADIRVRDEVPFNWNGTVSYGASPSAGYTGLANYIDDFAGSSGNAVAHTFGSNVVHPRFHNQAYYFQDTWKLRSNFTLSYGVRYENQGSPSNVLAYPSLSINDPSPTNFPTRIEQKSDNNNFGPRVSFAYTPHFWQGLFGENKTVVRAGYGVFYDGVFTNIIDNSSSSSPNAIARSFTSPKAARGTAAWSTVFAGLTPVVLPSNSQTTIANNLVNPLIQQWNVNLERELGSGFILTTGYVGTRGERLFGQNQLNPTVDGGPRVYPTRGSIVVRDNSGDSIYHAFNANLERSFRRGIQFRAAYTWSKTIDNVSEVFTSSGNANYSSYPVTQFPSQVNGNRGDRGLSAFDRRHRLAITYIYDTPKWKAEGAMKAIAYLANNWELSGSTVFQSGAPANLETGYDTNGDGISNDRPSLGNPNAPMTSWAWDGAWNGEPGVLCDGPTWWATPDCPHVSASSVHWIVPADGNGNIGRNIIRTPGSQTWSFSVLRKIKISERHSLEFRTELFNPFNHANTEIPNVTLISGSPLVGTQTLFDLAPTAQGNRSIRMWLRYSF